jgi:phosphoglycolate phosphatase
LKTRTALIFDLDGTLVDTLPDLADGLNMLLAEEGAAPLSADQVRTMVGDGVAVLVERGFQAAATWPEDSAERRRLIARFLDLYEPRAARRSRPFPGVPDTLSRLVESGSRLAICTNKPEAATHTLLRELDLSRFFSAIVGGDTTPRKKPDPLTILTALQALDANPEQAVMIGDSSNDVAVARAISIPVVVVTFGYTRIPPAELGADALISDFAELPEALLRVSSSEER